MKILITNPISRWIVVPVFRWIAFVPGAFLAAAAVTLLWYGIVLIYDHFVFVSSFDEQEGVLGTLLRVFKPDNVDSAGVSFLWPLVFNSVAARIAPRFKRLVVVVYVIYGGRRAAAAVGVYYRRIQRTQGDEGWRDSVRGGHWLRCSGYLGCVEVCAALVEPLTVERPVTS